MCMDEVVLMHSRYAHGNLPTTGWEQWLTWIEPGPSQHDLKPHSKKHLPSSFAALGLGDSAAECKPLTLF